MDKFANILVFDSFSNVCTFCNSSPSVFNSPEDVEIVQKCAELYIQWLWLPYDSEEARGLCGAITALMQGGGLRTSAEIVAVCGLFAEYEKNRESMMDIVKHAYRDGSKAAQPPSSEDNLVVSLEIFRHATRKTHGLRRRTGDGAEKAKCRQDKTSKERRTRSRLHREKFPDTRTSVTHKFTVAGYEGYFTVGLYPDDKPGELFVTMSKNGSTIGGLMDSFVTAVSLGLQYGVPLRVFIDKFEFTRFEPQGMTRNPDIPIAKSLIDYIFRWLKIALLRRRE